MIIRLICGLKILLIQPGDVPKTHSDVTDFVNDLGYKPDTTIEYGVERLIEWYILQFLQIIQVK